MKHIALVFLGGGLGSVARYGVSRGIAMFYTFSFPFGTLIANILACFILGVAVGMADHRQLLTPVSRLFWSVGFCGGFSTFSSFTQETLTLATTSPMSSAVYVAISLIACFTALAGGLYIGRL